MEHVLKQAQSRDVIRTFLAGEIFRSVSEAGPSWLVSGDSFQNVEVSEAAQSVENADPVVGPSVECVSNQAASRDVIGNFLAGEILRGVSEASPSWLVTRDSLQNTKCPEAVQAAELRDPVAGDSVETQSAALAAAQTQTSRAGAALGRERRRKRDALRRGVQRLLGRRALHCIQRPSDRESTAR